NDNRLRDAGVEALAASPHLKRLKALGLRDNGITAAGAKALARSENLPELTTLMFGLADNAGWPFGAKHAALHPEEDTHDEIHDPLRTIQCTTTRGRRQSAPAGRGGRGDAAGRAGLRPDHPGHLTQPVRRGHLRLPRVELGQG